ncbi:MAG: hypothetical protein JSV65_08200 [Armatimonadota bacterium]|nr:MAG: hypothetical protein JSV65_08200 [Armatimonadota bacterium]
MSSRTQVGFVVVVALAALMAATVAAFAQQPAPPRLGPMPDRPMPGMAMGMMGGCPMCGGMMGGMMGRSAVVAADDAVYVLAGNTVMKYDRDLSLLKQAEIPADPAKMGQMRDQMMQHCPMMQQMRGGQRQGGRMQPAPMAGERPLRRRAGMMGMCPMGISGGMMGGMMGRASLTVAGDAVYVMAGNRLLKYDRDLNLQNEAEIQVDPAKMGGMMQRMMESCPMMQQMPGGGMMGGAGAEPPQPGGAE